MNFFFNWTILLKEMGRQVPFYILQKIIFIKFTGYVHDQGSIDLEEWGGGGGNLVASKSF